MRHAFGKLTNISSVLVTSEEREPLRSVVSQHLEMGPNSFPNNGVPGYCWLCSACDISKYLGGTNVNLLTAHNYVHGNSHYLLDCLQGTFADVKNIIYFYTQKNGIGEKFMMVGVQISEVVNKVANVIGGKD